MTVLNQIPLDLCSLSDPSEWEMGDIILMPTGADDQPVLYLVCRDAGAISVLTLEGPNAGKREIGTKQRVGLRANDALALQLIPEFKAEKVQGLEVYSVLPRERSPLYERGKRFLAIPHLADDLEFSGVWISIEKNNFGAIFDGTSRMKMGRLEIVPSRNSVPDRLTIRD